MTPPLIVSPDTTRTDRLPPGQRPTDRLVVLHEGSVPPFDPAAWDLTLFPVPLVASAVAITWDEFCRLPRVQVYADFHCVTRWSKLDNLWEGVPTRGLLKLVAVDPAARFVTVHAEEGYSTNLSREDFFAEDVLLATHHNGEPLSPEHGFPVRLVVPRRYGWKSAKWVRGIEFLADDRPGYWESPRNGGYAMRGDPWQGDDGERFGPAGG